jgi:hypothetical protein
MYVEREQQRIGGLKGGHAIIPASWKSSTANSAG